MRTNLLDDWGAYLRAEREDRRASLSQSVSKRNLELHCVKMDCDNSESVQVGKSKMDGIETQT